MLSVSGTWVWDQKIGGKNAHAQALEIIPLVPIALSHNDFLVIRPTFLAQKQSAVNGNSGTAMSNSMLETFYVQGIGDPKSGDGWGIGPAFVAPAGSSGHYGSQETGVGVNAAIQMSGGPWIYGILGRQTWGAGGLGNSGTQNNTFLNPYVAYQLTERMFLNFDLNTLYNYDVSRTQNMYLGSVTYIQLNTGWLPITYQLSAKYNGTSIPGGPQGWGALVSVTFLLPHAR